MQATKWILKVVLIIIAGLTAAAAFNFWQDPLWYFGGWNGYKIGFNERQQKTDYLLHAKNDYNALLLGSSRSTYLDAPLIKNYRAFNYASNSMNPTEYAGYLLNFEMAGNQPELVIIGLDFWGANANDTGRFQQPAYYYNTSTAPGYRYKNLLSFDALRYGARNLWYNHILPPNYEALYDSLLRKRELKTDEQVREQRIRNQVKYYNETAYGSFSFRKNYDSLLTTLKQQYPQARFKVFTTPVTDTLLTLLAQNGQTGNYKKWLQAAVHAFGEVEHFMYHNSVSGNYNLFFDTQHFKPEVAGWILYKMGLGGSPGPEDFGITLTPENLELLDSDP